MAAGGSGFSPTRRSYSPLEPGLGDPGEWAGTGILLRDRTYSCWITDAGGQTLDQYWEDGPQLSGWGAVVARYADGTPAVVEGAYGSGWLILSGIHPEAPADWRRGLEFQTPVETDHAYAASLIRAALNRQSLPHY